ncbi:MAG: hypothetical protein GAK45_01375 [Pseudomonas citronellolis]|nr:MAG: hypothetical protein GAK45_01375 [Pseudomonas citronellolis]
MRILVRIGVTTLIIRTTAIVARLARGTARTQGAVLEATYRVEAAGVVVLVERQTLGRTVAIAVTQLGVEAQGVVIGERSEDLPTVIDLVERQVATRNGRFQHQTLRVAAVGHHTFVQGRLGPADGGLEVGEVVAFFLDEVVDFINGVGTGIDAVALYGQAVGQTRGLADRVADADARAQAVDRVVGDVDVELVVVGLPIERVVAQADTVDGPVGVDEAEVVSSLVIALGQTDGDLVTSTQEVVLADRATEDQTRVLREADAGGDRAGRLLFHAVVDVDLVIGTRDRRGLDVDGLEVAQPLKALLGLVDQVSGRPAAFHLAHLATQHLVFGLGVAAEVDAVDVGALARVDHIGDRHGLVVIVGLGYAVDVGEGIAFVTQAAGDQVRGGGHHLAREHLAFLYQEKLLHFLLRHFQVASELDVTNRVLLTFVDVDGDVDMFLIRGDRYLGRGDIHMDVATVEVVGTQTLQVTRKLFAGILVVVLEEGQPVGGLQLEQADQIVFGKDRIAHHVDVGDGRHSAFVDGDLQADAVTRLRHDLGLDARRVAALCDVLTLQFVAYAFEGRALEDFTFGQTGLLQTFHQVFGGDRLVTFDLDAGDGRAFHHVDDQYAAITTQVNVLEETGLEQRTSGLDQTVIVSLIAHVQRQCGKDAAGGNPLQTIDPDVGNCEGLSVNLGDHQRGESRG